MNIRDLAAEFGVSITILKRFLPDLFTEDMTGSTHIPNDVLMLARASWAGKQIGRMNLAQDTMQMWHELRELLSKVRTNTWEVTIDPSDQVAQVYIMITLYGEMKWADRGIDLYDRLVGAVGFLKDNMNGHLK
jgi:hypothetical protein